jgi:hypothetical protein
MRQIILLIIIVSASFVNGQNIKHKRVPVAALTKFTSLYPEVKDVYWAKQGKVYIAEFTEKEVSTSVVFDRDGKLEQVINFIEKKDLPKEAQDYLAKYSKDKALGEISKVKDSKGTITYIVEVKSQALVFDENGKFLRVQK